MLLETRVIVAGTLARLGGVGMSIVRGANVILARKTLEMLALAHSRPEASPLPRRQLYTECLDIHAHAPVQRASQGPLLRSLETRLWREGTWLLTSSPAFVPIISFPVAFGLHTSRRKQKCSLLENSADQMKEAARGAALAHWMVRDQFGVAEGFGRAVFAATRRCR